jgi:sugar phosphate isomerase/epimerase
MTALETGPIEFIELAAAAGSPTVSLFTAQPGGETLFPLVDKNNLAGVRQRLNDSDIRVANVDVLMLTPRSGPSDFLNALDIGAALGARGAVALVYDNEGDRAIQNLGLLCEEASNRGLGIAFELTAFTPAWNTLGGAVELLEAVGHPCLGIGLDILHLVRSGGSAAEVAALPPGLVAHAQLCDGTHLDVTADYGEEAASNRLVPGAGVFPLTDFLAALPAGTPLELEVPRPATAPAAERINEAMTAARALLSGQR